MTWNTPPWVIDPIEDDPWHAARALLPEDARRHGMVTRSQMEFLGTSADLVIRQDLGDGSEVTITHPAGLAVPRWAGLVTVEEEPEIQAHPPRIVHPSSQRMFLVSVLELNQNSAGTFYTITRTTPTPTPTTPEVTHDEEE